MTDNFRASFWGHQIDEVLTEIVRQASICKVSLLDPGVIDAVRKKSVESLGAAETEALVGAIRERITHHLGKS